MDANSSLFGPASLGPIATGRRIVGWLCVLGGTPRVLAVSCPFASSCCVSALVHPVIGSVCNEKICCDKLRPAVGHFGGQPKLLGSELSSNGGGDLQVPYRGQLESAPVCLTDTLGQPIWLLTTTSS